VVEGRNAESFGMGDKFTDANGDEVEVLRVIDRNMTVILDQKMVERSNQLKVGLEKKFYISFGDAGKVKHGLVQLESSGVKVLPRYQDKIGCEFIKHAELLKLQPSVNGGSVAAGMVREMINLYKNQPDKSVPELYKMAAQQMAGATKQIEPLQKQDRDINRPSPRV